MAPRLIICAAESRPQANRMVRHLINGGFAEDTVSILFTGKNNLNDAVEKKHLPAVSSMVTTAGIGAMLGGAFVWLSGMGILPVPGLGSLIIAGAPLVAAMSRSTCGGIADVLSGMGLSNREAIHYESSLRRGNILVSVSVSGAPEATAAKRMIRAIGVPDLSDTSAEMFAHLDTPQESTEKMLLEPAQAIARSSGWAVICGNAACLQPD